MPYGSWFIDSKTKMPSFKIKGFVFQEERPVEKPGRTSMVSTTSAKSSSSAGYVGLPGPFPLPGKTFRSRLSTVSSASSASSNPAWDGPFVKPFPLPESKQNQNVVLLCGKCDHNFPVDRHAHSSPVVNGSSPVIEEEISDAKTLTPRRGRKTSSAAGSTVSSGQLEEETSSSGAQAAPQASSTPTMQSRGRVKSRRKQDTTPLKSKKEAQPSKTPKAVGRRNRSSNTAQTVGKGEGEPVMARWGADGIYYPGWVSEPLTVAQVKVQFCDGQVKSTPVSKLVKADIITPGTLVLAATQSGEYEEALVVKVDMSGPEPVYMVERDKSERELQFDSIALNQSVVTELTVPEAQKAAAAVNFNDLSLENIIVHPRKRSARTPVNGGSGRKKKRQTTPQPCTSHGQTYSGPEETYGDTDSSTHSTCSLDLRGKEIKPLDIECFPAETTRTKLAYSRGNMAFKKKGKAEATVVSDLGPIPEPGSNLFTGCAFLITYTDSVRIRELNESPRTSSADDVIGTKQQLWRNRLQLQIRNGGGKVYNSFSEVTKEDLPNTYLITDKQCNTPLYLQCLVNNVPIYSHQIVIMCCAKNRQWKEVIAGRGVKRISGGYSLSNRCIVNPRSLTPLHKRNLLLALSGDPALSAFWQSLISKAGGSVDLHPHGPLKDNNYDVVVADTDCDRELVAEACSVQVPLVSMTWLHQVIITGVCLSIKTIWDDNKYLVMFFFQC
ncbi:TP53-binding protein 1-like isoform X2 [Macrosteles quadrilineatus]|uniref:TP53-binding protein 1-like isoform X2 n=1 Tax=Macrosteles quadrilineatus TaxID=74068 RepID=UPI0023E31558|nr:TP53-binding protein 1-like isoform X2 [Macrosteles quadrilineatus]